MAWPMRLFFGSRIKLVVLFQLQPTHLKNIFLSNWIIFNPEDRDENLTKYLSCHHLVKVYPLVISHSNGISSCLIRNTSSKGPFSIAMLDYRSVIPILIENNGVKPISRPMSSMESVENSATPMSDMNDLGPETCETQIFKRTFACKKVDAKACHENFLGSFVMIQHLWPIFMWGFVTPNPTQTPFEPRKKKRGPLLSMSHPGCLVGILISCFMK